MDIARTPVEWIAEIAMDPERRILFVEGDRDVAFWSNVVPYDRRRRSVVYPGRLIMMPGCSGGERGRLVRAAAQFCDRTDSVKFFVDADFDRLLGRQQENPSNVVLTDTRDLEGYALTETCITRLVEQSLLQSVTPTSLRDCIEGICRPLGLLRVVSARNQLDLPFQNTLSARFNRYVEGRGVAAELNLQKLTRALLQNCTRSIGECADLLEEVSVEAEGRRTLSSSELIHGKDAVCALGYVVSKDFDTMEILLHLALRREEIVAEANAGLIVEWLEG